MGIDAIKTALSSLPKNAYNAVNTVGATTIQGAKDAGKFIDKHTPEALKNIKTSEGVDTFVKSAKENSPEFVKKSCEFVKEHKDTVTGGAVILAAIASAISIIKSVADKIAQTKPQAENMHQG